MQCHLQRITAATLVLIIGFVSETIIPRSSITLCVSMYLLIVLNCIILHSHLIPLMIASRSQVWNKYRDGLTGMALVTDLYDHSVTKILVLITSNSNYYCFRCFQTIETTQFLSRFRDLKMQLTSSSSQRLPSIITIRIIQYSRLNTKTTLQILKK